MASSSADLPLIRHLLQSLNWSQKDLADHLGWTPQRLNNRISRGTLPMEAISSLIESNSIEPPAPLMPAASILDRKCCQELEKELAKSEGKIEMLKEIIDKYMNQRK